MTFLRGGEYAGAMCLATANDTIPRLPLMTIEELFTLENLNSAFQECSQISHWKETTQRYHTNLLLRNIELHDDLMNGTYKISRTTDFELVERGKHRHIEAPAIRDRIVQKILCQKILVPYLSKPLIYDNYASLKKRGTAFARKRIDILLRRYIRQYGTEGYILQIDVRRYFDSVDHEILKKMVRQKIKEPPEVMELIDYIIDSTGTQKGLNLGSEAPQIFAVFYLSPLDTFIKTVKGFKYYGRYMDDIFVIHNNKAELKDLLDEIKEQLKTLNLEINEKKTHITKLSHGFTFMQIKYNIDGGKIIKRPTHSKVHRERQRLRKYKYLYDKGIISTLEIQNAYRSWRNNIIKDCNACKRTIRSIDHLYDQLFSEHEKNEKYTREYIIQEIYRKEKVRWKTIQSS